jgi:hypothetical protein
MIAPAAWWHLALVEEGMRRSAFAQSILKG